MTDPRSAFLALDGIDGTGKSTQARLLAESLRDRGHRVTACVDPGGTELGARVRELLLHGRATAMVMRTEALLFMASRAELVERVIRPALARGEVVVSDRFVSANVVYQGYAGGLDPEDLRVVGDFSTGGLNPDLLIVLDLPVAAAKARRRGAADRIEGRGDDYFERVRRGFLAEADRDPERTVVIDTGPGVEAVHAAVLSAVLDRWASGAAGG